MKKFRTFIKLFAFIMILAGGTTFLQASADSALKSALEGSWEMESYETGGKIVPVSGLVIFAKDYFSMIYIMTEKDKEKSGRGHAGSFSADGDKLSFKVPWWVEYVDGKAMVVRDPVEVRAVFEVNENSLVIKFESGSIQKFKRSPQAAESSLSGAWQMIGYEGGGSTGQATGQILFSGSSFILIYSMEQKDGTLAGRAHGGKYRIQEDALTLEVPWTLQYVSGKGSATDRVSQRAAHFKLEDGTLSITYDNNKAVQKFKYLN